MSHILFAKEAYKAINLGLVSGLGVCLFGPGGHAKSMIIQEYVDEFTRHNVSCWVKSFNSQTTELDIFGGLKQGALERGLLDDYDHERGFQGSKVAVFEEAFDAPPRTLCALKDALTSRQVRTGKDSYGLRTEVIICATNYEPQDIADMDASIDALVSRLPIQWEVKWPEYSAENYFKLLMSVNGTPTASGDVKEGLEVISWRDVISFRARLSKISASESTISAMAKCLAKEVEKGVDVKPRTSVYLLNALKANAALEQRSSVTLEDFAQVFKFFGLSQSLEDLDKISREQDALDTLKDYECQIRDMRDETNQKFPGGKPQDNPIGWLRLAKRTRLISERLSNLRVPDALVNKRDGLIREAKELGNYCTSRAVDVTQLERG